MNPQNRIADSVSFDENQLRELLAAHANQGNSEQAIVEFVTKTLQDAIDAERKNPRLSKYTTLADAEAQRFRYSIHSLKKIASGEPNPEKYAVLAIKHIMGPAENPLVDGYAKPDLSKCATQADYKAKLEKWTGIQEAALVSASEALWSKAIHNQDVLEKSPTTRIKLAMCAQNLSNLLSFAAEAKAA